MSQGTVNILFTSAGRRVELLRWFDRARLDEGIAGTSIAADIDPLAPALQVADRTYIVPRLSDPGYVDALARIVRDEDIDLIVPLIDPDVPVLAEGRSVLEAAGARVVVLSVP
jgi:carbamoyl-phosphate synthase large subunit